MKEKVIELVGNRLDELKLHIFDVVYEKEDNINYLRIVLDSDDIIDMGKVVMATRIINPLLDSANIIEEKYMLDVYAKSKGDE